MTRRETQIRASRKLLLENYLRVDGALVAAGWPATSPWFRDVLVRFCAGTVPRLVLRVGRRGGKSTFLTRLAVAVAAFGDWKIPPGDTAVLAFVSVSLAEAKSRLKTVRAILDVLSVPYHPTAERINLAHRSCSFRAQAATSAAGVGFTAIALLFDEVAQWKDDCGANPAREVHAKYGPTVTTIPSAVTVLASAPNLVADYHAELVAEGDDESQMVGIAATWVANPTITEAQTRQSQPNERIWLREFAAVPTDRQAESVFARADVLHALSDRIDRGEPIGQRVVCCDPSSGTGGDSFAWIVGGWNRRADGSLVLCVDHVDAVRGKFANRTGIEQIVRSIARDAQRFGATLVCSDQREHLAMTDHCARNQLRLRVFPHTGESKAQAVERLRLYFESQMLALPEGSGVFRKELLRYQATETRTGRQRFAGKGKVAVDDAISCLVTLALADAAGELEGSPHSKPKRRDPLPKAGLQLESARHYRADAIDRIEVRNGRLFMGRGGRVDRGGGF